jgi:hypothetical protein
MRLFLAAIIDSSSTGLRWRREECRLGDVEVVVVGEVCGEVERRRKSPDLWLVVGEVVVGGGVGSRRLKRGMFTVD